MPTLNGRIPKYSRHKASSQAIISLDGKDHYLGVYGTPESQVLYDRPVAEWLANARRSNLPAVSENFVPSINKIIAQYLPKGPPTSTHSGAAFP